MVNKKDSMVVALATLCFTATLFTIGSIRSSGTYDPWGDVSGPTMGVPDGTINMRDIQYEILHFNTYGAPINRSSLMSTEYDSGWINVTDKAGQNILFSHGLGMLDWNDENTTVEVIGKTTPDGDLLRNTGIQQLQAWNKTYGQGNSNEAYSLVQTVDGGYALAGVTYSLYGAWDSWLVKTDAKGTLQWDRTYGGTGNDYTYSVIQTVDGGYALAGRTDTSGSVDFWLVRTDADGNELWNRTFGGSGMDYATNLLLASDGGYILVGYTLSYGAVDYDAWLVETDASGNMLWNKTYGGTNDDTPYAIVRTADGGYAFAGGTSSYGAGAGDFWLVKTDENGTFQWDRTYGGGNWEWAFALVQTDDGYTLAGPTKTNSAGQDDFWLVKTDIDGNQMWNKTFGGAGSDYARALVHTADDGYALTGYTESFGAELRDFWLVKTNANGTLQWNVTYGGIGGEFDYAYALVQSSDKGYALAGIKNPLFEPSFFWLVKTNPDGLPLNGEFGLGWAGSSEETINLYRGRQDVSWNYVRVRILKAIG